MAAQTTLIAQHSQGTLVVKVEAAGDDQPPGVRIIHATSNNQLGLGYDVFRVEHLGNGWYRIISIYSDMVFDVARASHASGASVILWPWHGGSNQRFRAKDAPALSNQAWGVSLEAQHSGKVLDVAGASQSWGAPLVQWDYHGGANQLFRVFGSPIKPMHSDLVLDVANGSQANGAPIIQHTLHGRPNQLFRLERVPEVRTGHSSEVTHNTYRIVANHSNKVLDVEGASHENGAKLIQWDWHGGPNQLFRIARSSGGGFKLSALHSGKALDVARASQDLGVQLVQWDDHGGLNQQFQL